jgi:hypothetical protein
MLPLRLALFAVRHLYLRIAITVALNEPFKAKVDQRGRVDDQLTRFDSISTSGNGGARSRASEEQQKNTR